MSLNGGYAMIKYNSTQEELQIAYRSKKPVLFYDENQRSHWAVIEETATESVDEETQEPITLYEYSYRLIDEASYVVANPALSGNEATLDGLEVDGTKYKVGGGSEVHLYQHILAISMTYRSFGPTSYFSLILQNDNPTAINLKYIRDTLGFNSPNNTLVISCLDTDKIYTDRIYINDDERIIGYGINLDTWSSFTSKVSLLGSYSINDTITQIF